MLNRTLVLLLAAATAAPAADVRGPAPGCVVDGPPTAPATVTVGIPR